MLPSAHYSASIEILERILIGEPAEKALLAWSRNSRFAGSKDRAAIRDIVFDILRKRRSYGARINPSARGLAIAHAQEYGLLDLFNGEGHAPLALHDDELAKISNEPSFSSKAEAYDFPEFIWSDFEAQYKADALAIAEHIRGRAPVDLRVNMRKASVKQAQDLLARDYVFTAPIEGLDSALRIIENPRKLQQSKAYSYGLVELQDMSSQIAAQMANVQPTDHVLDYCAGGGGKTLALGMYLGEGGRIDAWDISAARMKDIPNRAVRAGLNVNILTNHPSEKYDVVFVDAPCSGSGAWRRAPHQKFSLTQDKLDHYVLTQREVISQGAKHVKPHGTLVYATCSLFDVENDKVVSHFLNERPEFALQSRRQMTPLHEGDGFYAAVMRLGAT